MKVLILSPFKKGSTKNGESRYTTELIKNLNGCGEKNIKIDAIFPKNDLHLLSWAFYDFLILTYKVLRNKADIYHASSAAEIIAPVLLRKKCIVTLQDVIYLTYPDGINFLRIVYFKICIYFIKKADVIVTGSEFSKNEISKTLKIPKNKIKRIYLGIGSNFKHMNISRKDEKTIGYLGGNKGRKNVITLIKAFDYLTKDMYFKDYKLLLAIKPINELTELIDTLQLKNVHFLGNIPEEKIVNFYNSIGLFVYPSLYEGFGLPPLEAMRCKCPVICSNSSSVGEVVGESAFTVDTRDEKKVANAIKKLLYNHNTRKNLVSKGFLKSKEYTWIETALKTIEVYKEVYKRT